MTFFPQKTPSGGGFNQFAQTAAPLLLGIGAQARGDTAGIARGMALMQAKTERDQRKAAIDNLMSGMGISGAQKDFLSSLPVELQQQYMLQQMAPKERRTQVINGKLVDLDTLEVLGDFGDPGPQALTPDQMNGLFGGSDYGGGLDPYLVGGGTRPDAITGLDGGFRSGIESMIAAAPPEIQKELRITSGYRSPDVQERLFTAAIEKYGSADAARKWVAPPGNSKHNHGNAVDFKYLSPAAQQWVHANAAQYGLHFPLEHEPWHVEPVGSRGGAPVGPRVGAQPQQAAPQPSTLDVGIDRIGRVLASGIGTPAQRDELKFQRDQMIARRDAELKRLEEVRKEAAGMPFDTDLANSYRDDMRTEPALQLFGDVQSGFDAIEQFYTNPGAVSDYALAVAFAKIVDPGSVAREGEVAAVQNSTAIGDRLKQQVLNAMNGRGALPAEARAEIADLGAKLYTKKADRAQTVLSSYENRAKRAGIPFDEIWANGPVRTLPDDWVSTVQVGTNAQDRFAPPVEDPAAPMPQAAPMGAAMAMEAPTVARTVADNPNLPTEDQLRDAIAQLSPGQVKVLERLKPKQAVEYLQRLGVLE